jgi:hypothetical protein
LPETTFTLKEILNAASYFRILPWAVDVWDWEKRATFCFLGDLLSLHLEFGPELPDLHFQSKPARVISSITLSTSEPGLIASFINDNNNNNNRIYMAP